MLSKFSKAGKIRRSEGLSFLLLGATSLTFWCVFTLTPLT